MKASLPIFLSLVNLAFCHVLPSQKPDICKSQGPETLCTSNILAEQCNKIEFCNNYLSKDICERGPEAYCKTEDTAVQCEKQAFCSTWPDDSVTAIKLFNQNIWYSDEHMSEHYYETVTNMHGILILKPNTGLM